MDQFQLETEKLMRVILLLAAALASMFALEACQKPTVPLSDVTGPATNADDASPFEKLRAQYPRGIPWNIEFIGTKGNNLGALEVIITPEQARSCLSDIQGVRVNYIRREGGVGGSYGIAKITGNKIEMDLNGGGPCDSYLIMSGTTVANGSSTGELYTLGMAGGHDVGEYRASVRP